jgi:hypothetical protein
MYGKKYSYKLKLLIERPKLKINCIRYDKLYLIKINYKWHYLLFNLYNSNIMIIFKFISIKINLLYMHY